MKVEGNRPTRPYMTPTFTLTDLPLETLGLILIYAERGLKAEVEAAKKLPHPDRRVLIDGLEGVRRLVDNVYWHVNQGYDTPEKTAMSLSAAEFDDTTGAKK